MRPTPRLRHHADDAPRGGGGRLVERTGGGPVPQRGHPHRHRHHDAERGKPGGDRDLGHQADRGGGEHRLGDRRTALHLPRGGLLGRHPVPPREEGRGGGAGRAGPRGDDHQEPSRGDRSSRDREVRHRRGAGHDDRGVGNPRHAGDHQDRRRPGETGPGDRQRRRRGQHRRRPQARGERLSQPLPDGGVRAFRTPGQGGAPGAEPRDPGGARGNRHPGAGPADDGTDAVGGRFPATDRRQHRRAAHHAEGHRLGRERRGGGAFPRAVRRTPLRQPRHPEAVRDEHDRGHRAGEGAPVADPEDDPGGHPDRPDPGPVDLHPPVDQGGAGPPPPRGAPHLPRRPPFHAGLENDPDRLHRDPRVDRRDVLDHARVRVHPQPCAC